MNRGNFENWFKTQLVPNLPEKSLIIMDNASYHSGLLEKIPTKSWTKQRMIEWLGEKNIGYPEKAMKDQIWSIQIDTFMRFTCHCICKIISELPTS
ncbi:hypothetical protein PPYR_06094 [Photinus pyralis]|uniref:Tc1-like transposase DDE domain-containing protein n=1 Tax=Photinus pyralis TaxID=7054 RepID=A0A5N4ASN1_PHOPY|nr:hypothetical protein PPYR_06094 [Photinus pyralis]